MVQHRSDDPAQKSTLICAPLALLDQWKLEVRFKSSLLAKDIRSMLTGMILKIETKTNNALSCLIYHGAFFRL